jgi:large subunit ribosomal protein L24
MLIRVNDMVEVIAGNDRGQRGKVLSVDPDNDRLVVEGVHRVYKHVRRSQRNPQGGRLSRELPIHISSVMLVCPKCSKAARSGARYLDDGRKERYCKKCGASQGELAPPRPAYAKK